MPITSAGLGSFFADQADHFDQGRRGIADADDGAVEPAKPLRLAHRLDGAGRGLGPGQFDDLRIGNVVLRTHPEMPEAWRREADADHFDIRDDRRAALPDRRQTGSHRIGVEGGQAVEFEVGAGVNHAAHQRPLFVGVVVRPDLGVDDRKGVVLDGAAGGSELFGNRVGEQQGGPCSCPESPKGQSCGWAQP
jgi:hypothetical protein